MQAAAQAAPAVTLPEIGQAYGGGFVTGIYQQDGQRYLLITAGAEHELEGEWGEYGVKIDGASSMTVIIDGGPARQLHNNGDLAAFLVEIAQ